MSDARCQTEEDHKPKPKEVEKVEFEARPSFSNFRVWRMEFRGEGARGSDRSTQVIPLMKEIEKAKTLEIVYLGLDYWRFMRRLRTLASKEACGLTKMLHGTCARYHSLMRKKTQHDSMTWRQAAWMVIEDVKISHADDTVLNLSDLLKVELKIDNVQSPWIQDGTKQPSR